MRRGVEEAAGGLLRAGGTGEEGAGGDGAALEGGGTGGGGSVRGEDRSTFSLAISLLCFDPIGRPRLGYPKLL